MIHKTVIAQMEDRQPRIGRETCVSWRCNGVSYRGRGRIVALGLRQALVELAHPVGLRGEYPAGDLVLAHQVDCTWRRFEAERKGIPITPFIHKDFL